MKKKFILLAMMLLTLIGGVKFNVLNAQDLTVAVHGDATSESAVFPIPTYYGQAFAQTLYCAEDLEDIGPSKITSVAFKKDTDTQVRDFSIYMLNTDAESLSAWVDFSETDDKVYSNTSLATSSVDGWMTLTLDTPFEYTGGNIIVITWDKTKKTSYAKGCKYVDIATKTVALYNTNSTLTYDNYKTYTPTTSTRQPAIRFTYELSVPAVMPSSVPEITSIEATHNSVTLSWNAVENARKYNVYTSTGDLVNTVRATSCTIEGLDDLTEYCYQVSAVNGEFETEKSKASCATTLEAPKERTLVFELQDSYGDGWNGNYLDVYLNGSLVQSYATTSYDKENLVTKELTISQGTVIKVVYRGDGSYQYENTFTIYYKDGTLINGQEKISGNGTSFTDAEFVYGPLLLVEASSYIISPDQTTTLTATAIEFDGDVTYSWSLNGEIVGTDATYTFTPSTTGEYTFTCTVGTIEKSVTINVFANPFAGKQFRVKVMKGSYAGRYLDVYNENDNGTIGVEIKTERNTQIFTIEIAGNQQYYLKTADGYYIKCETGSAWWNVHAYNTYDKTPLVFEYTNEEQFYIKDYDKMTGNSQTSESNPNHCYFKVQDAKVYCDAPIDKNDGENHRTVLWSLEEVLPAVENLVANPTKLYPGETTTLTWNELEGAVSYNIYVDGVLNGNTKELTYGLSDLTYNVEPGHTIEVAAVYADATESGKASVTVQVAGTFTLTVNVTDGTNPIEGATVNVTTDEYTYDEFGNKIASLGSLSTDENGQAVFNNVKLLNPDTYNYYCAYNISATMDVYGTHSTTPLANYESVANGDNVTRTIVMTLPEPKNITTDKELYIAGEDVVLTWETPEFNTRAFLGYNVYRVIDGDYDLGTETSYIKLNEETLTETTYTIKNVEYGAKFAVSAVYNEGESSKVNANVQITTYANLVVNVKDANTSAGIDGAVVEIYSHRTGETETFVTANGGIVEKEYLLGYYTVTVKKNDSHYEVEPQEAQLVSGDGAELEFALTPKASIEDVTVTADNNGNVSWTGDYTKWNVYRRNTNAPQELTPVAKEVTTTSTTDAAWGTLEPGTYQYGVAGFVEGGTEIGVQLSENFDDGVMPEGWTTTSATDTYGPWTWYINNGAMYSPYRYSGGDATIYLITPLISTENAVLTFKYNNKYWSTTSRNDFYVRYATSPEGPWTGDYLYYSQYQTGYTDVTIDLNTIEADQVYIAFCNTNVEYGAEGIYLDDIVITGEVTSETETQIVWSNDVVKQGPATFIGGDTEKPTAWNVDANWSTGSVPADGAEVTINANAVITGAVNVSNLTINQGDSYPYNKLTVANGGALTVTGTISQASNYLLVLEEGGQIFQNNANVTARFSMSIDNPTDWSKSNKDGWQFISMPLENVSHDDFTSYGEYDLYKYDGSQNLEWQNHKDGGFDYGGVPETTFKSGVGYLASLKDAETATVYGTLNTSTSFSSYFAYNADKDLANFRLIGNPFTYDIKWGDMNPHQLADGFAIVNKDGGYEYYSAPDADIKVGQGFFIKAIAGETSYSQYNYSKQDNYSKQRSTRESNNSLNITATGNAGKDNVVINFAGKSEGFNKLQNFNDAIATVYVAEDGKNYGIYNCDADVQEVELSFNANKMGNYTISIEPNGKFQTVTLVDRFTGVETNMLVEDYNFTAMSEENPNRFIVRMVNGQHTTDNSHFVYQSGEELILNIQGEVQIVDVLGRVVYNGEAMNDINRINVSSFNSGAYMVKVMNGNEVKVEKVVIY